jgi:hypothetical protein
VSGEHAGIEFDPIAGERASLLRSFARAKDLVGLVKL